MNAPGWLASLASWVARSPRLMRRVFWVYALAIFVLTHWPALEVPSIGIQRTDILVHMAVFGCWTLLLMATAYLGAPLRPGAILKAGLVAVVYAAFDEGTQALPFVQRHAGLDDYAANVLGIVAACLGAWAAGWMVRRRGAG